MKESITRAAALAALRKYNHEPFHIQHALTGEGVMRWYAQQLGYGDEADFWEIVGLLTTSILRCIPTSTASSRRRSCVKTVSTSA